MEEIRLYAEKPKGYRPNAGIVLINDSGWVFAGKRSGAEGSVWQMPQGGIDKGEAVDVAALRELAEETGVKADHVEVLGMTPAWTAYDLPKEIAKTKWKGRYRGQCQRWLACRMVAGDEVVDLETHKPEFDSWRWFAPHELIGEVVAFKQPVYRYVFDTFRSYLTGWPLRLAD